MKTLLLLCFAAVFTVQAGNSQTITNWGESVQGVQLSITVTNSVFRVGSSAAVASVTKNSSTNVIVVDIFAPTVVFDLLLTSDTGKLYHVTTPMKIRGPRQLVEIKPGEESAESIPMTFGENIEPGDYTLKATRHFSMHGKDFELVSNFLKVQLK
jgi:hypothetical protein